MNEFPAHQNNSSAVKLLSRLLQVMQFNKLLDVKLTVFSNQELFRYA